MARISHRDSRCWREARVSGRRPGMKHPLEAQFRDVGATGKRAPVSGTSCSTRDVGTVACPAVRLIGGTAPRSALRRYGRAERGAVPPIVCCRRRCHGNEKATPGMARTKLSTALRSHLVLPWQRLLRCSAAAFPAGVPRHAPVPPGTPQAPASEKPPESG